jgi:hypothetical protein
MYVVNVQASPFYCSYARHLAGGVVLQSGQRSSDLGLSVVFNPLLQKDLLAGKIALRLNDEDHAFVANMLAHDRRAIVVQKPQAKAKPVAKKRPTNKPAGEDDLIAGMPRFTPESEQDRKPDALENVEKFMGGIKLPANKQQPAIPTTVAGQQKHGSLASIHASNRALAARSAQARAKAVAAAAGKQ